ncbi:glycoside hydrolase family 18 protein [Rhodococcus sp. HS-D2]|uniref:glycoside hydrolase family 18 protein n=1 Tax=Rhodococcus sp. HS-D2 TaxID=1384636 RepID=UPI0007D9A0F5|nr:glycoside hydrolase family 18 protein [Rhodococcus sp. HS-D2]
MPWIRIEDEDPALSLEKMCDEVARIAAVMEWAASREPDGLVRETYEQFIRALRQMLGTDPGLSITPACPPYPLGVGIDYGRAGWKVALVAPNGKVETLRADLDTIDQVRENGQVREWTIRLTPPAEDSAAVSSGRLLTAAGINDEEQA